MSAKYSPLVGSWWIYRDDGDPIDGEVMSFVDGGCDEEPHWVPWCEDVDEPTLFVAERFDTFVGRWHYRHWNHRRVERWFPHPPAPQETTP